MTLTRFQAVELICAATFKFIIAIPFSHLIVQNSHLNIRFCQSQASRYQIVFVLVELTILPKATVKVRSNLSSFSAEWILGPGLAEKGNFCGRWQDLSGIPSAPQIIRGPDSYQTLICLYEYVQSLNSQIHKRTNNFQMLNCKYILFLK